MKIKDLFEETTQSLIGMKIDGKILPVDDKWEGDFDCSNSQLTSLEGAPASISGDFRCSGNLLRSLEGAPSEVGGNFVCSYNYNKLTSFKDIHKQIKKIDGHFYCYGNTIKSNIIGLLLIDGLKSINGNQSWVPILNQAIEQFDDKRKRVMWAQAELIKELGEEGKALAQL
jgi:hypothetical protein